MGIKILFKKGFVLFAATKLIRQELFVYINNQLWPVGSCVIVYIQHNKKKFNWKKITVYFSSLTTNSKMLNYSNTLDSKYNGNIKLWSVVIIEQCQNLFKICIYSLLFAFGVRLFYKWRAWKINKAFLIFGALVLWRKTTFVYYVPKLT